MIGEKDPAARRQLVTGKHRVPGIHPQEEIALGFGAKSGLDQGWRLSLGEAWSIQENLALLG